MKFPRPKTGVALALTLALGLAACVSAPETGRSQLILVSDAEVNQMGLEAYRQIKTEQRISRDSRFTGPVNDAGWRIAGVSNRPDYDWEFTVFVNDEPNAFALPGGKVGVYTGMFDVAQNEDQLAAVMAHEVGHAIARHSAERLSTQALVQAGVGVIGGSSAGANVLAQAATLGVILPFSRTQESEADEIGLKLMARAGYDPRAAVALWQNFIAYGRSRTPEFLSTHPSPETRIARLQQLMPEALAEYERARR